MKSLSKARTKVLTYLNAEVQEGEDRFAILDNSTLDKTYGWIFFFQSQTYLETGDDAHMLIGNGPVVFLVADGSIHQLGTALPVEDEIERFERELLER